MKREYDINIIEPLKYIKKPKPIQTQKKKFLFLYQRDHTRFIDASKEFTEEFVTWEKAGNFFSIEMTVLNKSKEQFDNSQLTEQNCLEYLRNAFGISNDDSKINALKSKNDIIDEIETSNSRSLSFNELFFRFRNFLVIVFNLRL